LFINAYTIQPALPPIVDLYSCLLQQLQGHSSHALQLSALLQGSATSSNQQSTDALTVNDLLLGQLLGQSQPSHRMSHPTTNLRPAFAAGPGTPPRTVPFSSGVVPHCPSTAVLAQSQHTSDTFVTAKLSAPINEVPVQQSRNQFNSVDDKSSMAAKPPAYAKRAAFLNKRSLASGTSYRATSKKQKISTASNIPSSLEQENPGFKTIRESHDKDAFVLNQEFHPGDLPDLLFPWRLHDVLDDSEQDESIKSAICWNEDTASFSINNETKFSNIVMTKYFEDKDWESFCLSLSSWGFFRFTSGAHKGSFVHRLLVKGKRSLCKQMRIRGKSVSLR
jgi:HSF-type DNA-binding